MKRFKGIIALDIDGTITIEKHHLDKKVNDYLSELILQGWRMIFITGRTFSFAWPVLSQLKGEYFFAVQNGAALYEMPSKRFVKKHYISTKHLSELPRQMLIESGKEQEDICYYMPDAFTKEELAYLRFRMSVSPERWTPVRSFNELEITEFAAGKYFATEKKCHTLAKELSQTSQLKVIVIRDPFNPGNHLAFVNAHNASKGHILEEFRKMHPADLPAIGAGDDFNDTEMLEKSTFKIVMENAPKEMHALADLIAAPAHQQGIIAALKEATSGRGN